MEQLQWIIDHSRVSMFFYTGFSEQELVEELLKPLRISIIPSFNGYAIFSRGHVIYLITDIQKWKRACSNGVGAPRRPFAYTNTFDALTVLRKVLETSRTLA